MCEYILFFPLNFLHFSTLVGNPSKVRVSLRPFPPLIPNCRESGLAEENTSRNIQCAFQWLLHCRSFHMRKCKLL